MEMQELFKRKALLWAGQFDNCCYLDSNSYADKYGNFDALIAAGNLKTLTSAIGTSFTKLKSFYEENRSWMFGLLTYELKDEIESLSSNNADSLDFPALFFFIPEYLLGFKDGNVEVVIGSKDILQEIDKTLIPTGSSSSSELSIEQKIDKDQYLDIIAEIRTHINRGDVYEVTFCQEFFAKNAHIDPLYTFERLKTLSPSPFSGYLKIGDKYILSASPERFLAKRGNMLISQPIKGTARRGLTSAEDELLKQTLRQDQKEQSENVMIVDLVRNDLTRSAVPGTVQVEELFGIYSFPQVHQMISTITCELDPDLHFIDALKNTFPMGSMTGAPKVRAMELIEQYEHSRRGAYSGALGYITPQGDFDFNVIIRTILYNAEQQYLSFQVGGAITYAAAPLEEYMECMLKANALIETLKGPR